MIQDDSNLTLVQAGHAIDDVNSIFYSRFPYPQTPYFFSYLEDPDFERVMLNQDVGDYRLNRIPKEPNIWVAGCGTNQGVMTALRFPQATIIGSDISEGSLSIARNYSETFGTSRLSLVGESINSAAYRDEFDYVICTGVIHHNADPRATLTSLAKSLMPRGILELMVYNSYHWSPAACFQQAVQLLTRGDKITAFEPKLALARRLISALPEKTALGKYVHQWEEATDEVFADALLQPVLYGYTVATLVDMAADCGLSLLTQCVTVYDRVNEMESWETKFSDDQMQEHYDALPDRDRWQITNLITRDKAPYLWFYFQRTEATDNADSTRAICSRFLDTIYRRASTVVRRYARTADRSFCRVSGGSPFPPKCSSSALQRVIDSVNGRDSMRTIFSRLGMSVDNFQTINSLRIRLATSAFPHLQANPSL
jgi:SAM-dependent methyltransferase